MAQPNPKPAKPGFPASAPVLRRALARDDICPECGWELDTGWECNECGYDAQNEAYPPDQRARDARSE
jgi:ribosomal protein L37AE/L43A